MRTVFKFELQPKTIVPQGIVRTIAFQRGAPHAWIELDTEVTRAQTLVMVPTGGEVPENVEFVGSCVSDDLVLHIYKQT